jgi:hypothetical protein
VTDPAEANLPERVTLGLFYTSNIYLVQEQYLTYDWDSLVADFGGFLGLLLGHSIFTLLDASWSLGKRFVKRVTVGKVGSEIEIMYQQESSCPT